MKILTLNGLKKLKISHLLHVLICEFFSLYSKAPRFKISAFLTRLSLGFSLSQGTVRYKGKREGSLRSCIELEVYEGDENIYSEGDENLGFSLEYEALEI